MSASLYFRYAAMNSSKSASLQMVSFNYQERGMRVVIAKPTVDTKSPKVSSRIGLEADVDWAIAPDTSIMDLFIPDALKSDVPLACILIDEAQFLTPQQVDEFFEIVVKYDVPVIAYGLRSDFQTHAFPGSMRLLEIADNIEEIKTICRCGSKATFNGRLVNGEFVREGGQVAIDGQGVDYESLCGACFTSKVGRPTSA